MGDGDWTGAPVFLLFLPGAIFPLTFFFKWLTFKIALPDVLEIPIRYLLVAAFIESVSPLLIALTAFLIVLVSIRFLIKMRIEFNTPAIFLSGLFLFNWAINHHILAKILKKYYTNYMYMLLIFAAAAIGTASFPLAWLFVDRLLKL
jgi:hypothetical protein